MKGLAGAAAVVLVGVVALESTTAGASTKTPKASLSGSTGGVTFNPTVGCTFAGTALTKVTTKAPKVAARKVWTAQRVVLVAQVQVRKKGAWKTVATRQHTTTVHRTARTLPSLDAFGTRSGVSAGLRSLRVVESVQWLRPSDGVAEGKAKVTLSTTCTPAIPAPSAVPVSSPLPSPVVVSPTMDMSMPGMTMAPVSPAPDPSPSPSPSPLPAGSVTFHVGPGHTFGTQSGVIHAGDTVTVVDDDTMSHTFTLSSGGPQVYDSGNLDHGDSVTFTAPATGTYAITCDYHADMHGTLTVT